MTPIDGKMHAEIRRDDNITAIRVYTDGGNPLDKYIVGIDLRGPIAQLNDKYLQIIVDDIIETGKAMMWQNQCKKIIVPINGRVATVPRNGRSLTTRRAG